MAIARVFKSGTGQAVQLPKEFRFRNREIMVFRRGNEIILQEKAHAMVRAFELLTELPDDVLSARRKDDPPQRR